MEKLQPIIKHHFWVLLVPALLMPVTGWWLTTGDLAAEIDERRQTLESAYSGIPGGNQAPNDDWIRGAQKLIDIRTETNRRAVDRLWTWQKDLIEWPDNVRSYMADCDYRAELTDPKVMPIVPNLYRREYPNEIRKVWLMAEPWDDGKNLVPPDQPQKVLFPMDLMPRVDSSRWATLPPTYREIWNAQEDLWLLKELMLAIKRVNSTSNSITDANIRQVIRVRLFGGTRTQDNELGKEGSNSQQNNQMTFARPTQSRTNTGRQSAEFDISEEYQIKDAQLGGGGRGFGIPTAQQEEGGNNQGNNSNDPNSDENRYIASEDAYRTRGFELVVTMHQMYVPELVRELMNANYPADIVRLEKVAANPDNPDGSSNSNNTGGFARVGRGGQPFGTGNSGQGLPGAQLEGVEDPTAGGEFATEAAAGIGEDGGFEGFDAEGEGGNVNALSSVSDLSVKAALSEIDLVQVAIAGELYLYNPPPAVEGEQTADASATAAAADPATSDLTDNAATQGTEPETAPGQPVDTAAGTEGQATPAVTTQPEADTDSPAGTENPAPTDGTTVPDATTESPPATDSSATEPEAAPPASPPTEGASPPNSEPPATESPPDGNGDS